MFVTTLLRGVNTQSHENKLKLCYLHVLLPPLDTAWPCISKKNILKDKNYFCWKEKVIGSSIDCIDVIVFGVPST